MEFFVQNSFANRYGEYAKDLEYVGPSGSPNLTAIAPLIIGFITMILGIIILANTNPKNPNDQPTELQKVMRILGFILLFSFFISLGFYGYIYMFKYMPEYYEWFESLPNAAKTEVTLTALAEKFKSSS